MYQSNGIPCSFCVIFKPSRRHHFEVTSSLCNPGFVEVGGSDVSNYQSDHSRRKRYKQNESTQTGLGKRYGDRLKVCIGLQITLDHKVRSIRSYCRST